MPLVSIRTSAPLDDTTRRAVLGEVSRLTAQVIGKPERYVMVTLAPAAVLLGGTDEPAAFADVRSIGGLGGDVNGRLAEGLCRVLQQKAGIEGERVYCTFTDVPAADWAWNGSTFG